MTARIRDFRWTDVDDDDLVVDGSARHRVGRSRGQLFRVQLEADVDAETLSALLAIVRGDAPKRSGESDRLLSSGPRVIDGEFVDGPTANESEVKR